jgi:hypothetical protein
MLYAYRNTAQSLSVASLRVFRHRLMKAVSEDVCNTDIRCLSECCVYTLHDDVDSYLLNCRPRVDDRRQESGARQVTRYRDIHLDG